MATGGCAEALVNTHDHNHRALALYTRLGFTPLPDGLVVLGSALASRS
jgi:ribosomal protein S18 acetylase RimI-like enzyme